MDPLLVISPHLDDGALSVGQVMAGREGCVVATIFTGTPPRSRWLTTYDRDSGFRNAREAMATRRREDRTALGVLSAWSVHLGLLDNQYRGDADVPDEAGAVGALVDWLDEHPTVRQVVGPLGLAHPDHAITARIFMGVLLARPVLEGFVYEDLPSRVLWPELVPPALDGWRTAGWEMTLGFIGTGPIDVKEQAVTAYVSQQWALDRHVVLCPERIWEATRRTDDG